MITDSQRFTVIFIFATILITGAFGLYVTHAEDFGKLFSREEKDDGTSVYQNDTIGFAFAYPTALTLDTSQCAEGSTNCTITVIDEKVPLPEAEEVNVNKAGELNVSHKPKYTSRTIFTFNASPMHPVAHCDALKGRVEGGFVVGNTTYQPCVTPKTVSRATEGMHLETSINDYTYTINAEDYYGDRALLQGIFITFQTGQQSVQTAE